MNVRKFLAVFRMRYQPQFLPTSLVLNKPSHAPSQRKSKDRGKLGKPGHRGHWQTTDQKLATCFGDCESGRSGDRQIRRREDS